MNNEVTPKTDFVKKNGKTARPTLHETENDNSSLIAMPMDSIEPQQRTVQTQRAIMKVDKPIEEEALSDEPQSRR